MHALPTARPTTPWLLSLAVALLAAPCLVADGDRETRVRDDRKDITAGGRWIYNDLDAGFAQAKATGRPLLVVFRCIPCDACRGFDEQIAALDERVSDLLGRFVRVRVPQANGLDLSLFQLDFDLSFFAVFLNADRTIYGRFGSRSTQKDKTGRVSIGAFREALETVLDLHAHYPANQGSLRAKRSRQKLAYAVPEDYPQLAGRYKAVLDYGGDVVKSCIHCHQIRDAERLIFREGGRAMPDEVVFPWPSTEVFGMTLDPRHRARIASVAPGSIAARQGFRAGDELLSLAGQPLVSIADASWVLHNAPQEGHLTARVQRGDDDESEGARELKLELPLTPGWRRRDDISWRVTSWELRRMGTGGMLLEEVPARERRRLRIGANELALRAKHVGQHGEHATAKRAGFRKGDIIVAVDGRTEPMRESDLFAYAVQQKKKGDTLKLTVLRYGERRELSFRLR